MLDITVISSRGGHAYNDFFLIAQLSQHYVPNRKQYHIQCRFLLGRQLLNFQYLLFRDAEHFRRALVGLECRT
ncbi:hypothetical protein D3C73_854420 [compost metagenome]